MAGTRSKDPQRTEDAPTTTTDAGTSPPVVTTTSMRPRSSSPGSSSAAKKSGTASSLGKGGGTMSHPSTPRVTEVRPRIQPTSQGGSPSQAAMAMASPGASPRSKKGASPKRGGGALIAHDELYTNKGGLGVVDAEREFDAHGCRAVSSVDPWQERWNMALLVLLYLMQGVPLGLTLGSMPFMLQSKMSYSQVGFFSIAAYPYSLKLFWSPIVDSLYNKRIGRRKSWIIPVQLITGWTMIAYSGKIDAMMENADIKSLTAHVFVLVFMAATQDIAVDGWALTLLSKEHVEYASTCQTIGTTTGFFTSFTVFLALNNPRFCNDYVRTWPLLRAIFGLSPPGHEIGIFTLPGYLRFWGWVFILVTVALAFFKKEDAEVGEEEEAAAVSKPKSKGGAKSSVWKEIYVAYSQLLGVMKLKSVWLLTAFLVTYRLGVLAAEGAYSLKLIDKGVSKEALSFLVLFQFPIELISAYLAGRWASNHSPYPPIISGYFIRLVTGCILVFLAAWFPAGATSISDHPGPFLTLAAINLVVSFASALTFTSLGSFFNKISDPLMGGAYLTMLNTIANLGYIGPRAPLFFLMDYLTVPMCTSSEGTPLMDTALDGSCPKKLKFVAETNECTEAGGTCALRSDGFYIVTYCCLVVGTLLGLVYMRMLPSLMKLPLSSWRADIPEEKTTEKKKTV